jgi:hypothetical protein
VRFPPVGDQVERIVEIEKVGTHRSKLKRGRVKSLTVDEARAEVRNNPHTVTRKQRGIVSRREKEKSRREQELAEERAKALLNNLASKKGGLRQKRSTRKKRRKKRGRKTLKNI